MATELPVVHEPQLAPDLIPTMAQAEQYFAQAKADNTLRSYASGWRDFAGWCADHHLSPFPAAAQTVVLYLTQRAEAVSVSTLTSRLAAIRFYHHHQGCASPTMEPVVRDVLSGIRRVKGTRPSQVTGMTREVLDRLLAASGDRLVDRRNRALLVVAYDLLGRRSELVALDVDHLFKAADGSATVLIQRSKTDQTGAGMHLYLAPDTVSILDHWLASAGITTGALFQSLTRGGRVRARLSAVSIAVEIWLLATFRDVVKICGNQASLATQFDLNPVLIGRLKSDYRQHS